MRELILGFRLWRATWRMRFRHLQEVLTARYERATCPHSFRPARVNGQPGRFCRICESAEQLEQADFYAQFGERGMAMLTTGDFPWQPSPPEIHTDTVA